MKEHCTSSAKSVLAILFFSCCLVPAMFAAPGSLDRSFGVDGKLSYRIGTSPTIANAIVTQPDGKFLLGGSVLVHDSLIIRLDPDGSIDTTFGDNGSVITPVSSQDDSVWYITVQSDGKIVTAGYTRRGGAVDAYIARYESNGTLDDAFGVNGIVIVENIVFHEYPVGLAIQPDGKILLLKSLHSAPFQFVLNRFNTNGTMDLSFNQTGMLVVPDYVGQSLAVQPDGKIVVAGAAIISNSEEVAILRFKADGSFDNTFDGDGIVKTWVREGVPENLTSVLIQPDGKIVAAGNSFGHFGILRLNSDGSPDTGFGSDGRFSLALNGVDTRNIVLQTDGKIVAGLDNYGFMNGNYTVLRITEDGRLDTAYGGGGITRAFTGFPSGIVRRIAIQSDNRILAVGFGSESPSDLVVFRFLANGSRIADFDNDIKADLSVFRPDNGTWYRQNSSDGAFSAIQFGLGTDKFTPADYDGDGKTDIAVFRDGIWYILNSSDGSVSVLYFGSRLDVPTPADYDGDSKADAAVYRNGIWYILNSRDGSFRAEHFGTGTDKPIVGDFDGDGRSDLAVYRDGTWYVQGSTEGFSARQFGLATDKPVAADYDGDGRADIAVYRDGVWYLQQSFAGFTSTQFGLGTDTPVPADYDGDGRVDIGVYRDGIWYILGTTDGFQVSHFGLPTDRPVPSAFLP